VDGQYPLGSVFKVITAAAGLHEGVFTPQTEFNCQGMLDPAHPNQFRCDIYVESHGMHGMIPFRTAVQKSCNIYFYHVAELLSRLPNGGYNLTAGAARLEQWALKFGFGQPTGIGMGRDPAGSLKEGDARNLAVGQGGLLVTPLQVAQLYGLVATDGHMPALRLIQEHGPAGPSAPRDLGLNPRIMAVIRDALESVVEPGGTAYSTVYLPNIRIAGKTGTAQASRGEPHAWFAGYAPANNPRVAFAIIVEHGGHGGKTAGPIAREIVRKCADHGYLGDAPVRPTLGARPGPTPQAPAGPLAPARPLG
jgi:penicillin-binding protein 2